MSVYDEFMQGAIDVHCHIDLEFSANERKREPEFHWLPKAEAAKPKRIQIAATSEN